MSHTIDPKIAIRVGDLDGLGRVYSEAGELIVRPGETVLKVRDGCDAHVSGSWRSFFARGIFSGMPGKPRGTLYITTHRMVLVREIDIWKQVKPLLTPLSLPAAAEKEARLKKVKSSLGREYCEIPISRFDISRAKRKDTLIILYLTDSNGEKYRVIVYTDVPEPEFFSYLQARFSRGAIQQNVPPIDH